LSGRTTFMREEETFRSSGHRIVESRARKASVARTQGVFVAGGYGRDRGRCEAPLCSGRDPRDGGLEADDKPRDDNSGEELPESPAPDAEEKQGRPSADDDPQAG
jgi:hypothetical protein